MKRARIVCRKKVEEFLLSTSMWFSLLLLSFFASAQKGISQINTDNVMIMGQNALYYDDYVLSIRYFNQVIDAKPFLSEPYYFRALAKFYLEDYQSAENDCSTSILRNPFIPTVYQLRALCYSNLGQFDKAELDYSVALKSMPDDQSLWFNRALSRLNLKKYDSVATDLDTLQMKWPNYPRTYSLRAQLCIEQKDTLKGLHWLTHSLRLDPKNAPAWAFKGGFELEKKKYLAADSSFTNAIQLSPKVIGYYLNRALARYNLNRFGGVLDDYDKVVSLDPKNFIAHYNRGLLRMQVGDLNRAIGDFNFIIRMEPSNMLAILNRAELREKTGDFRGAIRDYSRLLSKYSNFLYGYYARAKCRRKVGDIRGAVADERHVYVAQLDNAFGGRRKVLKKVRKRSDKSLENYQELVVDDVDTTKVYEREYRGKVQNQKVEPENQPLYTLSFYNQKTELNNVGTYLPEIDRINKRHYIKATLYLTTQNHVTDNATLEQIFQNIKILDAAIVKQSHPQLLLLRSVAYTTVRNFAAALNDASAILKTDSTFALAHLQYATICLLQNEVQNEAVKDLSAKNTIFSEVLSHLNKAITLSSNNAYLYYNRACLYEKMGKSQMAIKDYSKAISLNKGLAEAYFNRGLQSVAVGQKEQGVSDLSRAGELGLYTAYSLIKKFSKK